jgi:CheY-like chemotaxis protein
LAIFFAAAWQWVRLIPGYDMWFISPVYPAVDLVQFVLLVIGVFLFAAGIALYADFWQTRKEEMESREGKLSILENLQLDARQPYPVTELMTIALKEVLYAMPGSSGAVFLINRKRRQFVLTAWAGLNKQEVAHLEYYPLERNLVTQAIELGDPVIAGEFAFIDRDGATTPSRFHSVLVLPLVSGLEKIGGVLLFCEEHKFFRRSDISFLSPVAEWLAEKIKSARLSRELTLSRSKVEEYTRRQADWHARLFKISESFEAGDAVTAFCRGLIGLVSGQSVHLYGVKHGALQIYGGSEPLYSLSENYKTALLDALGREKPLIVNQEGADEGGSPRVVLSSLIVPFELRRNRGALLFRRELSSFSLSNEEVRSLEAFANLARLLLDRIEADRMATARRVGFDKVLELIRFEGATDTEGEPASFVSRLADVFPKASAAVTFVADDDGGFRASAGFRIENKDIDGFHTVHGEGGIGRAAASGEPYFVFGRSAVAKHLETYETSGRDEFIRLFGERGYPSFLAYCPVARPDAVSCVTVIFMYDVDEDERREWERFLTLASGLYSLRLAIGELQRREPLTVTGDAERDGRAVNRFNDCLSAIIGNAELASRASDLPEDVRSYLSRIIDEAEKAGSQVEGFLAKSAWSEEETRKPDEEGLNTLIQAVLRRLHISGDLHMAGGRPRVINVSLQEVAQVALSGESMRSFIETLVDRFASWVDDDDVIDIGTYQRGEHVYMDISRHGRNFPPVNPVATFGRYESIREVLAGRPADVYLTHISDSAGYCAIDQSGRTPAFVSFKLPARRSEEIVGQPVSPDESIRVLVIDDEAVILDLVAAMCQSMGYEVETALSGEEGLKHASAKEFDVVLTDLAMPGMSGLAVAREIRKTNPKVPIILVTGWGRTLQPSQIADAGITDVLYKPFRIEQLTEAVKAVALTRR